jgi:hypothetical protein
MARPTEIAFTVNELGKHIGARIDGVETDWTPASFTASWKFTRRRVWATFDKGEAVCPLAPQRRGKFPDGSAPPQHETRMRLRPFTRVEDEICGWPAAGGAHETGTTP